MPTSQRPSRRAPGVGSRSAQPKRSAPSRRHATRLRELNGMPFSGSSAGSLAIRSSIGSMPQATASSSIADSSANMPGHSPGARIHDGVGTSSATSRCVVSRSGAAYMWRVAIVVCSANSRTVEVCSKASCPIARSRPSRAAPRRTRWIVGRAVADHREQLLARERDLDGPLHELRGDRGEHGLRLPRQKGTPQAAGGARRDRGAHGRAPRQGRAHAPAASRS